MTAPGVGRTSRLALVVGLLAVLLAPAAAPHAVGEPAPEFLEIRIDSVTPDVVTTSSEPSVTVTGTVTNVGDRPVRDIVGRLERGPAVTTAPELRTSLAPGGQFQPVGEFVSVATQLDRGQAAGFQFAFPLRSAGQPSLGVDAPGVYPLLVNVNGTPDYGAPALLDERRFLLPVSGVPAGPSSGDPLNDIVTPDTTAPVAVTMLWPLADKPRLAPGVPGGTTPVRLMNDDLAVLLAAGGRLDTLLGAAEFAASPGAIDPSTGVDTALCLAVDPDLLVTVNAMTVGYVVAEAPDGLGTAARPGTGQAAAVAWLDRLRALARRMCVMATPYAQADLGALQRVGDPGLSAAATSGAGIVDRILGVTSTRGVTVLGDGPLTDTALSLLNTQEPTVAIAPDAGLGTGRLSGKVAVAWFDPAVGAALAAVGTDPTVPAYLDAGLTVAVGRDSPVARRQDAVGAILWQMLQPASGPRAEVLVPPMKWSPQPDDARLILTTLANAVRSGLAVARPLTTVIADATATSFAPDQSGPQGEDRGRFDDDVVTAIGAGVRRLEQLEAALTTDSRTGLTGPQYTAPLREDMLRALSQTEPTETRNDIARQRLSVVSRTIEDLFRAVTVVNPGDSYTLASERSALPLALRNDLGVPIRVRLSIDAPPGMTVTDIGEQELPPGYLPLRVPVEVRVTQRVAVDVTLRTPDGVQLGDPVRLSVHSNAYGKVLFAITLGGGAVLALLVGRRLYHRFRGQPDRADLDPPVDHRRRRENA
ncbi:MAG: hypothetical protein FGM50_04410 [Mycobacterium sp.]|nr:hypothetical protein [Mycobacterium sp.]